MEKNIFDDHAAFNRWKVTEGMNVNESGTEPSVYITEIKLKKLFRKISNEGIENLFDKEMSLIAIERHRQLLEKKLASLEKWQLLWALSIYLTKDDIDRCAAYVLNCKKEESKNIE